MNLSVFWVQETPIVPHAVLAIFAIVAGIIQLLSTKGTTLHKWLGYAWAGSLAFVAISGLFIHEIKTWGMFSPIHILSFVALIGLWRAIHAVRSGNIRRHKIIMQSLFFFALVLTGLFTLLPGRAMHAVFFGLLT